MKRPTEKKTEPSKRTGDYKADAKKMNAKELDAWHELLMAILRRRNLIGKRSKYYIGGYRDVLTRWGALRGRQIDLRLVQDIFLHLRERLKELGEFP